MVSLLIVSHSRQLAQGVKEFVDQAAGGLIQIGAAGGNEDGTLGINVPRIQAMLETLASPEGILVLADLGSAVMGIQTALEMLDDIKAVISDAPLVEGAYLAAVEASTGASLDETAAAALQARQLTKVQP